MKITIIINGAGGVGKDTLCEVVAEKYSTMNVSSIDPIKAAARMLGWNDQKDLESRKFLSDLKQLSIDYNDWPTRYLINQHKLFQKSDLEILFVHIREGSEIDGFKNSISGDVVTLLIRRNIGLNHFGNDADDDVEDYNYDYVYDNNLPLKESRTEFLKLVDKIIQGSKRSREIESNIAEVDELENGEPSKGWTKNKVNPFRMTSKDSLMIIASSTSGGLKDFKLSEKAYAN